MPKIPKKVSDRITAAIKTYKPIVKAAMDNDINESNTVTIIKDIFADMLGYDKYTEVTSEYAIKGTFVDLAIKVDNKIHLLIEVKAIGETLKDKHVTQAVDYGCKEGVEWVVLTNAVDWRIYKIKFGKPVEFKLIQEFNLDSLNTRSMVELQNLYLLSKEGIATSKLDEFLVAHEAASMHNIAAILLHEDTISYIKKALKKINPGVKISNESVLSTLENDVIKRNLIDSDELKKSKRAVAKKLNGKDKSVKEKSEDSSGSDLKIAS